MILGPSIGSVLRLLLPLELRHDLAAAERSLQDTTDPAELLQLGKVLLCAGRVKLARDALARADTADPELSALVDAYRRLTELADFGACHDMGPGPPPSSSHCGGRRPGGLASGTTGTSASRPCPPGFATRSGS